MAQPKQRIYPFHGLIGSDLERLSYIMDLDLLRVLPEYNEIRDCLLGEHQVKSCGTLYLPPPTDDKAELSSAYANSPEYSRVQNFHRNTLDYNPALNDDYYVYKQRAVFWNFTQRHHQSLVGQMFVNEPKIELPPELEPLIDDCDGDGTSIVQFVKSAFGFLAAYARCGLYADFPLTLKPSTVARPKLPIIGQVNPFKLLAWQRNENKQLSSVLVEESYNVPEMFTTAKYLQYRHLVLVDNKYMQAIYRPKDEIRLGALHELTCITPELNVVPELIRHGDPMPVTDFRGNSFSEIAFEFCGGDDNRESIDPPLLGPVASANLSDYRTSADLEQMLFLRGQPTVWIACNDPQLFEQQYPDGVTLGSRSILQLGEGGNAGVVQIGDSDALTNNMDKKRERIADLGVSISRETKFQQTATEVAIRSLVNNSAIASAANNLSIAMSAVLRHAANFIGANPDKVDFQIDLTRSIKDVPVEERKISLEEYRAGILSRSEVRAPLERAGKTHLTPEESQAEIDKEGLGGLPMREEDMEDEEDKPSKKEDA